MFSICHLIRKPNNTISKEYAEECSEKLSQIREVETDRFLPYFVKMQKLAVEAHDVFDYDDDSDLPELDAVRMGFLAKAFNHQLDQLQQTFPPDIWENGKPKPQSHARASTNTVQQQ